MLLALLICLPSPLDLELLEVDISVFWDLICCAFQCGGLVSVFTGYGMYIKQDTWMRKATFPLPWNLSRQITASCLYSLIQTPGCNPSDTLIH